MAAVIIFFTVFFFLLGLLAPSLLCRTGIRRPQSALLGAGIVLGGLEILLIAPPRKPRHAGSASPANIPGSSPIGHGCTVPGGQDDKSPVTRDCHAGICGSRRVRPLRLPDTLLEEMPPEGLMMGR
jgi:hypothetical protein